MIKFLSNLGMEGNLLNPIKCFYGKSKGDIILNSERENFFHLIK